MFHFIAKLTRGCSFSFSVLAIFFFMSPLLIICLQAQVEPEPSFKQVPLAGVQDRITNFVDDEKRITLHGNRHPLVTAQYDAGEVASDYPMQHMLLTLLPSAAQQDALDELVDELHDPESPAYHRWLTPEEYGERFGVSESDIAQIVAWLQTQGLEVDELSTGHLSITFSGTAGQVASAFHTEIHTYNIGGVVHHANVSDPQIPIALAGVVGGIVSLHDFRSVPMHNGTRLPVPAFTNGGSYYMAPADFATIYDLGPIYQQSINGSGQSVAVVGRSNINIADIRTFRSAFDLPANDPQIIINGSDPGIVSAGEETEADLDVEWSGAVARGAAIKFVVSKSTNSSDGTYLSAQYIVNHNLAPVMSMSFGLCEVALGSAGNAFINRLWQQAAVQGITVFVSSGDSGAAGCDSASASRATHGRAVNGLCSSPYSVCVGGTEFKDSNQSLYWSSTDKSGTQSSALSYIPEVAWNESGSGSGLWGSGGGASALYAKPFWQSGTGVPADSKRDVPDISLSGAGHDGYLIYQNGGLYVVGGTSASVQAFAGVMALVVQGRSARQGNANTVFYPLADKQRAGGDSVFHDTISGNNSVPGQLGYSAGTGYDQVTGLGSIDASVLVSHWGDAAAGPTFHVAASSSSLLISRGSQNSVGLSVRVSDGFNAPVFFSVSGLPRSVSASFTPATLLSPGSGNSVLKIKSNADACVGSYSAVISVTSKGSMQQIPIKLTCASEVTQR